MSVFAKNYSNILLKKSPLNGLLALNINFTISHLAISMLSIFGPVFLYQLADNPVKGIVYVVCYIALQRSIVVLLSIPAGYLVARIGYRLSMFFGLAAMALQLYILSNLSYFELSRIIMALVAGALYTPLYFLCFHALFLDDNKSDKVGQQIGILHILGSASEIISPVIAGIVVQKYGFNSMFSLSVVLMLTSLIPLNNMGKHKRHGSTYSLKNVINYLGTHKNTNPAIIFWALSDTFAVVFWPIYLITSLQNYSLFGVVFSLLGITNIIVAFISGRIYDKKRANVIFSLGTILTCISWIPMFGKQIGGVIAGGFVKKTIAPLWWMKIRRRELLNGEKHDHLVFAVGHEIIWCLGMVISLVWAGTILILSNMNFQLLVIPALLSTLAASIMVYTRK